MHDPNPTLALVLRPHLQLFKALATRGMPSALAKYLGIVAVGMSDGSAHVLMPIAAAARVAPG